VKKSNRVLLLQKIFRVMEAIPELVKTGQMQEGDSKSYAYHEADSIRERFRNELIAQRMLCLPSQVESSHWGNATHSGGTFNYAAQKITFTFYDCDTGASLSCQAEGWGGDALDKAAPKAAIQALKYFLTNGFFVKGIELDGDSPEEQIAGREANRQHQWFEGRLEAAWADKETAWVVVEGTRLYAKSKKLIKQIGKISDTTCLEIGDDKTYRIRTFMGQLNPDSKNPHPIIDKIEVLDAKPVPQTKTES
jgi:hypothetical protein